MPITNIKPLQCVIIGVLLTGLLVAGVRYGFLKPESTEHGSTATPANCEPVQPMKPTGLTIQGHDASVTPSRDSSASVTSPASPTTASAPIATNTPVNQQVASPLLKDSPLAEEWLRKEGITVDDIEVAQSRMAARGYPALMQEDPGLVRQFLPLRNVVAVHATSVSMPERAAAGSPVPFRMSGVHPDASYRFDRFDMVRNGPSIRIRAIGTKSGEPAPGVEIPVELDGAIDPLPPGEYIVEFPELGPSGARKLIIE